MQWAGARPQRGPLLNHRRPAHAAPGESVAVIAWGPMAQLEFGDWIKAHRGSPATDPIDHNRGALHSPDATSFVVDAVEGQAIGEQGRGVGLQFLLRWSIAVDPDCFCCRPAQLHRRPEADRTLAARLVRPPGRQGEASRTDVDPVRPAVVLVDANSITTRHPLAQFSELSGEEPLCTRHWNACSADGAHCPSTAEYAHVEEGVGAIAAGPDANKPLLQITTCSLRLDRLLSCR
mgnify:CR=1 FL=1